MTKELWLIGGAFALIALIIMNRKWTPPLSAQPYLTDIQNAEYQYNMPKYLLARLLHQESHYRDDIIFGDLKSSAGAVGIAQIVPRWHPNVDPTNPTESIYYAAKFLTQLKERFGSWDIALAGYNWGPTAVSKAIRTYGDKWLEHAPEETQNYVSDIWGDVA